MTEKVDITAPVLPKVEDREEPITNPTLPRLNETAAALEPVIDERLTSSTLELDPQEDIITDERPVYRPRSIRPAAAESPKPRVAEAPKPGDKPKPKLDMVAGETTARRGRALPARAAADGFEGASLENVAPIDTSKSAQLLEVMKKGGWIAALLIVASILLAIFLATQFL